MTCYICDDPADHDGRPHSAATGDNRVRGGIIYTGRNTADVRAFVDSEHPDRTTETWFVTRNQTAPTGGQAWRYIKADQTWPDDIAAAVYDPADGHWLPVRRGDIIRRDPRPLFSLFTVESPA